MKMKVHFKILRDRARSNNRLLSLLTCNKGRGSISPLLVLDHKILPIDQSSWEIILTLVR